MFSSDEDIVTQQITAICNLILDIQKALNTELSGSELVEHARKCAEAYERETAVNELNEEKFGSTNGVKYTYGPF